MDLLHLHLLLNHVPVIGLVAALLVLLWGVIRRSAEVMNVGLVIVVVAGLAAGGTFLTGEPAEERVEGLPGVAKPVIETHEDAATIALIVTAIAAVLALVALVMPRKPLGAVTVIVIGAVAFGLMARAANLGGQIRHTELGGAAAAAAPASGGETDDDD